MASPTALLFRFDLGHLTFRRIAIFHSVAAEPLGEAADGVSRGQTALMDFHHSPAHAGVRQLLAFQGESLFLPSR